MFTAVITPDHELSCCPPSEVCPMASAVEGGVAVLPSKCNHRLGEKIVLSKHVKHDNLNNQQCSETVRQCQHFTLHCKKYKIYMEEYGTSNYDI